MTAHRIVVWLRRLEDATLVSILLAMLLLAVTQIGLRNFFDSGIIWGDSLLRVLVLWVGLVGAMVASRNGAHINIDIVSRLVKPATRKIFNVITSLATTAVAGLLAYHSYRFVVLEYEDGLIAFANVPNWVCELILPFAFGVIAMRYLALSYIAMSKPAISESSD